MSQEYDGSPSDGLVEDPPIAASWQAPPSGDNLAQSNFYDLDDRERGIIPTVGDYVRRLDRDDDPEFPERLFRVKSRVFEYDEGELVKVRLWSEPLKEREEPHVGLSPPPDADSTLELRQDRDSR